MSGQEIALAQGLQGGGAEGLALMGGAQGLQAGGMGFQAPQGLGLQMPQSNVGASSIRDLAMGGSNIPASLAGNAPSDPNVFNQLAHNPQAMQGLLSLGKQQPPQMAPQMQPTMRGMPRQIAQMPQVGAFNPFMARGLMGRF